jgi:hypothetical protein
MKGILAILMAGIMLATMIAPAMGGTDATTSAAIGNATPDVSAVSVSPDPVTMAPCPATTPITVTATVSDANGVGDITSVQITDISPAITDITPPITMTWSKDNSATEAEYTATINLPCCTAADDYTMTVTATDNSSSSNTGTGTFTVNPTVGITVTNVGFGSVAPNASSTATSTVTCTGNAQIEFVDEAPTGTPNAYNNPDTGTPIDGIIWSDMISGLNTIDEDNISTTWTPATPITCGNSADVPFTLEVPSGTPEGTYLGTITFTPTAV